MNKQTAQNFKKACKNATKAFDEFNEGVKNLNIQGVKKWEIWKSPKLVFTGKVTQKMYKDCTKLHKRYKTRKEAEKVSSIMKTQGVFCCVRKRKELV